MGVVKFSGIDSGNLVQPDEKKLVSYSSDSNRQPVALISNITLIPPSTRSKNDAITSIYTSTFSQKYTITLIDTSMQF